MEDEELIKSETEPTEVDPQTPIEIEEVEDPYFHLRDGNYIGGLTMP